MISLIHSAFKNKIEEFVPAKVKVGYGDIEVVYRKVMDCKGTTTVPIFGFSMVRIAQWNENTSTGLIMHGYPDSTDGLSPTVPNLMIMPVLIEYSCFYLTNKMDLINKFVQEYLFFNYKKTKNQIIVTDPEVTDIDYGYQLIFQDECDLSKQGNEYEIGYQYVGRFNVTIRGPIRLVEEAHVVDKIRVKIYLDDILADTWEVG